VHYVVSGYPQCLGSGFWTASIFNKLCGRPPQYAAAPYKLTFDLEVVSESRVTCAISMPILVFLGLSVLDLGPTYATD